MRVRVIIQILSSEEKVEINYFSTHYDVKKDLSPFHLEIDPRAKPQEVVQKDSINSSNAKTWAKDMYLKISFSCYSRQELI